MMKTMEIKKSQLKELVGEVIPPFGYKAKLGENIFEVYLDGQIPILIKSKYTKFEFESMCR